MAFNGTDIKSDKINILVFYDFEKYIDPQYEIEKMRFEDACYLGSIFNMPLGIVLNTYCNRLNKEEMCDLYYLKNDSIDFLRNSCYKSFKGYQ